MARPISTTSLVALALAAGSVSSVARAQSWASPADGAWFNALNWTPQAIPTGAGATATLGLSGAYTVSTPSNSLLGVNITNPAATMGILGGNSVSLVGAANTLNGQILVNQTGAYAGTSLYIGAVPASFTGTGTVRLNASTSDGSTTANTGFLGTAGGTLTMGAGTKLAGFGRVGNVSTINNGTFTADIAGRPLLVSGGTHQNNALYTAANGGGLVLDGCTVTQSGSGSMSPGAGSSVQLSNTSVTGGSLVSSADGRVQVNPGTGAGLAGVSIVGGLDVYNSSTTTIGGAGVTFVGGSTMLVNVSAAYAGTHVRFPGAGTPLNGNGTLRLNASTSDGSTTAQTAQLAQDGASPGGTVVVAGGVQIAGFGLVNNLGTTNNGAINADIDGRYLRVEGGTHQNNNLYQASGGGMLLLNGAAVNQAPGAIILATGTGPSTNPSSVQLSNTSVTGGTLVSTGAARVQLNGNTSATLSGVAVTSGLETYASSVLHIDSPGLTLNGGATVTINASGAYAGTSMRAGDPDTLIGGAGTVRLNASTSDGSTTAQTAALLGDDASASFTFGPSVTLAGFGEVALPTTNNGTFRADIDGRPLRVQGSTQQNNRFYQSINGGSLVLVNTTVNQALNASILAGAGSSVILSNSTINNGTVGSPAGSDGLVIIDNTACDLENVSISRQLSVNPSGLLYSASTLTLTNNAVVTVNTSGAYAGTSFRADGTPTVIAGTGRVQLNASTSDGSTTANTALMSRNNAVDGSAFLFGPGVTVEGFGRISGVPTTNNGKISANVSGRPLRIDGVSHQNNNRYESANGGALQLVNTTAIQSPAGVINAGDGSDLELSGATVLGGTFSRDGTGYGVVTGNSTIGAGLTLNAPMYINANQGLTVSAAGITNNNVITVNSNAAYAGTGMYAEAPNTPINGSGEVRLNRSSSDGSANANTAALAASAAGNSWTLGTGQSLTGSGSITAPVTLSGVISPGFAVGDTSFIRNSSTLTLTDSGRLHIDVASTSVYDLLANVGTVNLNGALEVVAAHDFAAGTTFDVISGGTHTGEFDVVFSSGLATPKRFGARYDNAGRVRVTVLCGPADIAGQGADGNGDGVLDNNDFIVYIDRFFANDPRADVGVQGGVIGHDGEFNNNDFIVFIDLFFAGCF